MDEFHYTCREAHDALKKKATTCKIDKLLV